MLITGAIYQFNTNNFDLIHSVISLDRQPTILEDKGTLAGNFPVRSNRQMVVRERPVNSCTSFDLIIRSGLDTGGAKAT